MAIISGNAADNILVGTANDDTIDGRGATTSSMAAAATTG